MPVYHHSLRICCLGGRRTCREASANDLRTASSCCGTLKQQACLVPRTIIVQRASQEMLLRGNPHLEQSWMSPCSFLRAHMTGGKKEVTLSCTCRIKFGRVQATALLLATVQRSLDFGIRAVLFLALNNRRAMHVMVFSKE